MEGYHQSVLLKEAVDALSVRDAWYLDCTLGDGGHSLEIIKRGGKVVGIDVDPLALGRTKGRLGEFEKSGRLVLVKGNFRDIKNLILQTETLDQKFAGAIFDLGVSSLQLETPERGFSFGKNGPLDMRMDPRLEISALDLLKVLSRKELYEIFHTLGEEKYSWKLAAALAGAGQISTTKELADLIEKVVGGRKEKIHPATRVFQALRMAVNDELGALQEGLDQVKDLIKGNLVIISFHSLEDRIVKNTFKNWQKAGFGEILTEKPIVPTRQEITVNPRARSAKMRVFNLL